ncbi:MAG: TIGR00366 family protein [Gracilibacteraceae bacterium]|jgi:short-chain fatty acids transporter|nr:TIGR00366 family protein [Gracilibacteraceae bacterium]
MTSETNTENADNNKKKTFVEKFIWFFETYTPNSMVWAFLLTVIVIVLALIFTNAPLFFDSAEGQTSVMNSWTQGFWSLMTFAMQMSMIMITGNIVAVAPPVQKLIRKVAVLPNNWFQAYALVLISAWILIYFHWGIGMMVGIAMLRNVLLAAKEKGYPIHGPALVAATYCCTIPGIGISQAAPLYGNTPGYLKSLAASDTARDYLADVYPLTTTVLGWKHLVLIAIIFVMIFVAVCLLVPKNGSKMQGATKGLLDDMAQVTSMYEQNPDRSTFANWINNSRILSYIVGIFGAVWCVRLFATQGIDGLTLNNFIFVTLMAGFLLCGTPERFTQAAIATTGACWGIIVQFPLYAGIFGIIVYTGLSDVISNAFLTVSTSDTFLFVAYIYSSILNLAVPSGGSKFVIEAPYLLDVAAKLNIDIPALLLSYTFGDLTTNAIQPFWCLPHVALCHVEFRKMLPYTLVFCIGTYIVCTFFFLVVF